MKFPRFILFVLGCSLWSCDKEALSPESPIETVPEAFVPHVSSTLQVASFPQPERNPISTEGVILGKNSSLILIYHQMDEFLALLATCQIKDLRMG